MPLLRTLLPLCCLTLLAACSLPSPVAPVASATPAPAIPATTSARPAEANALPVRSYTLAPEASTLHILVYRGGSFARLGHNHVVSSRSLQGRIWQGSTLAASGFDIRVPVNELIVDDNATRTAEGEDFPLNLSEDAKESTRANMLRDTLLDGARYPEVHIRSLQVQGTPQAPTVLAALRIRDQTREVSVPVTVEADATGLRVRGSFALRQSDFGITPLSLAMGALQVVDTVQIRFDLRGLPDTPAAP